MAKNDEPTNRELLDAIITFRTSVTLSFNQVNARLNGIDAKLVHLTERIEAVERQVWPDKLQ